MSCVLSQSRPSARTKRYTTLSTNLGERRRSHAHTGVYKDAIRRYMESIGWEWTPTMKIGQGCRVHLCAEELPSGRLVVSVSRHSVAVIDGVVHDIYVTLREAVTAAYTATTAKLAADEENLRRIWSGSEY